ncbi:pimeloyl-ACP methyl ester carboxylesterase [Paenibacillus phyllosphaerae]|uniref:Pimeloyl-ACP methyl ester carboxylesterase n=1 Tax=Paenibacillus phyllosphaerae TaxID=274593 RepID=A0A7W5ATY5_9BACL|nr:alpha/beta hydrolase [Paenibacillus phyllosphaerae]MBB3108519.1 pimeloyl-ACP methyl ester carboxylesterase [Paenibacillus phyllosphaerae]
MTSITLANRQLELPNGQRIAYYDSGEVEGIVPQGTAVILLHGFCGSSAYWEEVLPYINKLGRIVIPDLRGHGMSSAPQDETYEMEAFADDLNQLIGQLGLDQICLFGHSLGGYVSLAFAEKHADKLKSFSLVHSTSLPDSAQAKVGRDKAIATINESGIGAFVEGLVPKLFAPDHLEGLKDKVARIKKIGEATSPAGAAATALGMKNRMDRRSVLENLKVPRLLIAGSEDGVIPAQNTFTSEGTNVSQVLLSGSGHMSMVESPSELGNRIVAFVRHMYVKI